MIYGNVSFAVFYGNRVRFRNSIVSSWYESNSSLQVAPLSNRFVSRLLTHPTWTCAKLVSFVVLVLVLGPILSLQRRFDVIDENYLGMHVLILAFDSIPSLQHWICHAYVVVSNVID